MRLFRFGEFELIERIRNIVCESDHPGVVGIGDDGAVFSNRPDWQTILTVDALVEGVHFDLSYTPLRSLGWKALAINLSDIGAMGGIPNHAVVALALPGDWEIVSLEAIYTGMKACGDAYGCTIVGGDTVRSKGGAVLSVTVIGEVEADKAVTRSGARVGDLIAVTGSLGGARTGLDVLNSSGDVGAFSESINRFLEPKPRIVLARKLIEKISMTSLIDISDGLSSEMCHLCAGSALGCVLDENKIPIHQEAVRWADAREIHPAVFALDSGEEYELLFTFDPASSASLMAMESLGEITVIGEMVEAKEGRRIINDTGTRPLESRGWDHFGS